MTDIKYEPWGATLYRELEKLCEETTEREYREAKAKAKKDAFLKRFVNKQTEVGFGDN